MSLTYTHTFNYTVGVRPLCRGEHSELPLLPGSACGLVKARRGGPASGLRIQPHSIQVAVITVAIVEMANATLILILVVTLLVYFSED